MYGKELILDLRQCAPSNRSEIKEFCRQLCELIGMERCDFHFWDDEGVPEKDRQTNPKTTGISAIQFILTSSIVIHYLSKLSAVYINIFSCEEFDTQVAENFTVKWFESKDHNSQVVIRQ